MAEEIERKFLVHADAWHPPDAGTLYRQGYLCRDPERTVRVRVAGARGFLTVKGATRGVTRAEFEYEIPLADATQLLALCPPPLVEKTRWRVDVEGHTWEVDRFHGDNTGLLVAEIELPSADAPFTRPPWLGDEVSDDPRYFNANLAVHPYTRW